MVPFIFLKSSETSPEEMIVVDNQLEDIIKRIMIDVDVTLALLGVEEEATAQQSLQITGEVIEEESYGSVNTSGGATATTTVTTKVSGTFNMAFALFTLGKLW